MKKLNTFIKTFLLLAALSATAAVFNSCEKDEKEHNPGVGATATTDPGVVINDIRWATRNVNMPGTFAEKPEDSGMLYQWNSKVAWTATNPTVPSDGESTWNSEWNGNDKTVWETQNNPCPKGWRVPIRDEWNSLVDTSAEAGYLYDCNEFAISNGTKGKFYGDKTGNKIFLPATGEVWDNTGEYHEAGSNAWYWGNNARDDYHTSYGQHILCFYYSGPPTNIDGLYDMWLSSISPANGFPIRCVAE
jgi:uncharacterized protein (TIGR02145 family)